MMGHKICNYTVLMMGHKICFYGEIWIDIPKLSKFPLLIWSTVTLKLKKLCPLLSVRVSSYRNELAPLSFKSRSPFGKVAFPKEANRKVVYLRNSRDVPIHVLISAKHIVYLLVDPSTVICWMSPFVIFRCVRSILSLLFYLWRHIYHKLDDDFDRNGVS